MHKYPHGVQFNAKIRKIGTSLGIIIPLDILRGHYNVGDFIQLKVITDPSESITSDAPVMTKDTLDNLSRVVSIGGDRVKMEMCKKHEAWKSTCGCK